MFNKFRNFLVDIFSFTSIFFTFIVLIELIFQLINKNDSINVSFLKFSFVISIVLSIINYLFWYTDLLEKFNYKIKYLLQYCFGLFIIYICNDLTDFKRIAFLFIYYNILYFGLYFVFVCKQKKDVDKLNKIIMKLKEEKDE